MTPIGVHASLPSVATMMALFLPGPGHLSSRSSLCVMDRTLIHGAFTVSKISGTGLKRNSSVTSVVTEARDIIALAAGPRRWSDSVKAYINRGARVLGITPGRAVSIWYAKVDDLRASEWVLLQEKAAKLRAAQQEQEARNNEITGEIHARRALAVDQQREPGAIAGLRAQGAEGAGPRAASIIPKHGE